jgi:hypothetical protein
MDLTDNHVEAWLRLQYGNRLPYPLPEGLVAHVREIIQNPSSPAPAPQQARPSEPAPGSSRS